MKDLGPGLSFKYVIAKLFGGLHNKSTLFGVTLRQRELLSLPEEKEKLSLNAIFSIFASHLFSQSASTFLVETQQKMHR